MRRINFKWKKKSIRTTFAVTSISLLMIMFQNCTASLEPSEALISKNQAANTITCSNGSSSVTSGDFIEGFINSSALYPALCGSTVQSTCQENGEFDGEFPLYADCIQYCQHPDSGQPVAAGSQYSFYEVGAAASQGECDSHYVTTICNSETGLFDQVIPANRHSVCMVNSDSVQGDDPPATCAYPPLSAGLAQPTGTSPGSTVTGYTTPSALFPSLCGESEMATCQANGSWNKDVPLYSQCQQFCLGPDSGQPVLPGTSYSFYTIGSGTQEQCQQSLVTSLCQVASGKFAPQIPDDRFQSCNSPTQGGTGQVTEIQLSTTELAGPTTLSGSQVLILHKTQGVSSGRNIYLGDSVRDDFKDVVVKDSAGNIVPQRIWVHQSGVLAVLALSTGQISNNNNKSFYIHHGSGQDLSLSALKPFSDLSPIAADSGKGYPIKLLGSGYMYKGGTTGSIGKDISAFSSHEHIVVKGNKAFITVGDLAHSPNATSENPINRVFTYDFKKQVLEGPFGLGSYKERDNHNKADIVIDSNNNLHSVYTMHNGQAYYRKMSFSTAGPPTLGAEIPILGATHETYPRMILDSQDNIYLFLRSGDPSNTTSNPFSTSFRHQYAMYVHKNGQPDDQWTRTAIADFNDDPFFITTTPSRYYAAVGWNGQNKIVFTIAAKIAVLPGETSWKDLYSIEGTIQPSTATVSWKNWDGISLDMPFTSNPSAPANKKATKIFTGSGYSPGWWWNFLSDNRPIGMVIFKDHNFVSSSESNWRYGLPRVVFRGSDGNWVSRELPNKKTGSQIGDQGVDYGVSPYSQILFVDHSNNDRLIFIATTDELNATGEEHKTHVGRRLKMGVSNDLGLTWEFTTLDDDLSNEKYRIVGNITDHQPPFVFAYGKFNDYAQHRHDVFLRSVDLPEYPGIARPLAGNSFSAVSNKGIGRGDGFILSTTRDGQADQRLTKAIQTSPGQSLRLTGSFSLHKPLTENATLIIRATSTSKNPSLQNNDGTTDGFGIRVSRLGSSSFKVFLDVLTNGSRFGNPSGDEISVDVERPYFFEIIKNPSQKVQLRVFSDPKFSQLIGTQTVNDISISNHVSYTYLSISNFNSNDFSSAHFGTFRVKDIILSPHKQISISH